MISRRPVQPEIVVVASLLWGVAPLNVPIASCSTVLVSLIIISCAVGGAGKERNASDPGAIRLRTEASADGVDILLSPPALPIRVVAAMPVVELHSADMYRL